MALATAIAVPLTLYCLTVSNTVRLEDDGLFLMAGHDLGIAHPPGYPVFTWLMWLALQVPFGNPALLGHLLAAGLGALTCGALYHCARLVGASPAAALAAALLFGVSEQLWSQAIITDVYTLNTLLFFTLHGLLIRATLSPGNTRILYVAGGLWGLALAAHWPLTLLATPGLMLVLAPAWRTHLRRLPGPLGLAAIGAAIPYTWTVWRSRQALDISFYPPITTWSEFWHMVSRRGYAHVDTSVTADWTDRWAFMEWMARDLVAQLTIPGAVLAAIGLWVLIRRGGTSRATAAGGAAALAGNNLVLILLLGFDFDENGVQVFRAYPLVSYGITTLWAGLGIDWISMRTTEWAAHQDKAGSRPDDPASSTASTDGRPGDRNTNRWTGGPARTALAGAIGTALVIAVAVPSWRTNDRRGPAITKRYAETVLETLPEGAVLFSYGQMTSVLGYYHLVENRRPDINLYNTQALVFTNRLYDRRLPTELKAEALAQFVGNTNRTVFMENSRGGVDPGDYVAMYKTGQNIIEIAKKLKRPQRTLSNVIRQWIDLV